MSFPRFFACLVMIGVSAVFAGCSTTALDDYGNRERRGTISDNLKKNNWPRGGSGNSSAGVSFSGGQSGPAGAQLYPGSGEYTRQFEVIPARNGANGDGVTLNLVNVPVAEAAKVVMGEILAVNYVVDDAVSGQITIQTSGPVSKAALIDIFQAALSVNGAAISAGGDLYRIVPAERALAGGARLQTPPFSPNSGLGVQVYVVPLRYVSARNMEEVLRPIAAQNSILLVDETRNIIVVAGTQDQLSAIIDAVRTFDVDYLKGTSFALFPLDSSDPEAIARELDTVFGNDGSGPAKGIVRFVPNKRLNSILVIAKRPQYLQQAAQWVSRLDRVGRSSERQLYVYNIQNRPASELAALLQQIYAADQENTATVESAVAPAETVATVSVGGSGGGEVAVAHGAAGEGEIELSSPSLPGGPDQPPAVIAGSIKVVADESNNALLVLATAREYKRVLSILQRIDAVPNQVFLEATIAEVRLNDELKFGLRWFFERGNHQFTFTDAINGAVSPVFPGFSYFFSTPNVGIALNALASVTDVKVISSPTLMVLDNREAVLQVGDDVPIATQSAVAIQNPGAPIVNSVAFRETGVKLTVTPRVSDSGRVVLDIEQEVSDATQTTTSGIDSPTIQQRRIRTTVAVQDGEGVALGGLMQERNELGRDQVPIAGDIPVIGNLFKSKRDEIRRTELLIIITPHVVRDTNEARGVTEEFRRQLSVDTRPVRGGPLTPQENINRLLR